MYRNLEEFREEVYPKIDKFQGNILNFGSQISQMEIIIQRFDEVLLTKASKVGFDNMTEQLSNFIIQLFTGQFITIENLKSESVKIDKITSSMKEQIFSTNENME